MMATVPHVTAWAGRTKYQADRFLFDWVYKRRKNVAPYCEQKEFVSVLSNEKRYLRFKRYFFFLKGYHNSEY